MRRATPRVTRYARAARRAFHVLGIAMSANGIGIGISKRWKHLIDLETRSAVTE